MEKDTNPPSAFHSSRFDGPEGFRTNQWLGRVEKRKAVAKS